MAIYDLWLSRNNGPTLQNYVGHSGRMFYDSDEKVLRVADGVTPGGFPVTPTTLVGTTEPTVAAEGQMWFNPDTFELWCYHDGNFEPTIDLATNTKIGGVKLGPGVITNAEGQIIIDSTGLDFSFGDFSAITGTYPVGHPKAGDDYAVLQSTHVDEDAYLASNGTGSINLVGEFNVYRPDGGVEGAIEIPPILTVKNDGQIQMLVPGADSTEGALSIIGGLDGVFQPPVNTGVMLHITGIAGTPGVPSRVYNDAQNAFAAFVARRYNGTAASPTAVLANEEIMRLSGTAHNGTTIPGTGNQRIVFTALGNQTLTNQGGAIELWATPINTTTLGKVATVDSVGLTMASGKVITQTVRNAGVVSGTTVTLDFNTDAMVHCTFADNFTVAFSNYTAGRTITLIATNTSAVDSDIITTGISSVRMQGDSTLTVTEQTTAIITYYCVGTTVNDVYASAVYA